MKDNKKEVTTTGFFNGPSIGKSLKEVAVDLIQTERDEVLSRWFHAQPETDLFTWVDKNQNILKQQLSFFGQVVEWNCIEGLKTGVIIEEELSVPGLDEIRQPKKAAASTEEVKPSEVIKFDKIPMQRTVTMAIEIVSHLQEGDETFRTQLLGNFREPQSIDSMNQNEFINRFGLSLKNYQRTDHGFWESLRKYLQSFWGTGKKTG